MTHTQRSVVVAGLLALLAGVALGAMLLPSMSAAGDGPLRLIHSERSLYRQVLVYQDSEDRCLCFTRECAIGRQSCMDLRSPDRLVFEYAQMMLGALYLDPQPRSILIIGLGGGTLPGALERLLPQADIDVVEIDPAVVRVAQQYFGFHADARVHVIVQDGRVYVRGALRGSKRYQLIMLDAYDSQYIPEHMLTREFLSEVRSLLTPDGIVAANTFSSSRLYQNESVTYGAAFGPFYNLKSGNRVILAARGALPSLQQAAANARRFSEVFRSYGFSADAVLARFSTRVDWDPHARVLTDQYSPANLLNSLGR
ncbi:MAG TPA: fused MFS/spermidine synthase [Steroidobacteraceae bacterium]|jgi:spermidine synthase|nr:fused MFS/spermidine synthase [Steroidobacteraceae bacterium]